MKQDTICPCCGKPIKIDITHEVGPDLTTTTIVTIKAIDKKNEE